MTPAWKTTHNYKLALHLSCSKYNEEVDVKNSLHTSRSPQTVHLHGNRFNLGQRQRYSGYMWYVLRTLDAHERVPSDISSKNTHHKPTVRCSQSRGVAEPVEARHRENNKYPKHETWSTLSCRLSRFVKRKLLSVIAWNASDGRALVTQAAFNAARLRLSWRINKHQYAPFRDGLVSGVSKGDRQIMIVQKYI